MEMAVLKMIRIKESVLTFFFYSVVLGVLLCSGVVASAGVYYVDVNNGDDDNAGTAAAPWKTLHYSLTQISSGTLNVAAGTYRIASEVQVGFELDDPLTIEDDNITIIGEGDAAIGSSDPTAVIDGSGAGTWKTGIQITGSNCTIKGISITNFLAAANAYGIDILGGTENKVRDCKIFNNTDGIRIKNSSAFKVQDCEIYSNTDDGLSVETSTGGEIHRNTIYRHNGNGSIGVDVDNCSPSIKRNKIYDNLEGIKVLASGGGTASPDIFNNVIYETTGYIMNYGIRVYCANEGTARPTIYHNSIDGGSGYGIAIEWFGSTGDVAAPVIKYNIITRCDSNNSVGIYANNASATCVPDYNDVWGNKENYDGSVCTAGTNDIERDPENGGAGPLPATSPCVDAIPTNVGDPVTMDYLGYKRPKGSGYDMGPYEYIAQLTYTDTLPGGTGAVTDYDIFTIPLTIGNATGEDIRDTMEATLGTYNQATWRVFSHATNGDVEMNTDAFTNLDVKPGLGLWGITTLTNTISFSGTLAPDAIYYKMKLAPGWHLFAVPWPDTSINLGNIYVTNGVNQYTITGQPDGNGLTQEYIWDYTGTGPFSGYEKRTADDFSLTDGVGFFIKVLGSSDIILSIPPDNSSDPPNNSSSSSSLALNYVSPESVRLSDDSEPPPLPGGSYGPMPDIRANGKSGPLIVSKETPVSITVSLDPGDQVDKDTDWWVVAHTPFDAPLNWYSYVYPEGWRPGIYPCAQTPLFQVTPSFEVLDTALPSGSYIFYFAVDGNMDGEPDSTWQDTVEVKVE
jgi:parallel beta-helix repeat protein